MTENENLPMSMTQVLDHVVEQTQTDKVSLGDIFQTLGTRSYGPILFLVALISMLPPISITPGLPMVTGSLIIILSAQLLFLRRYPWLPARILRLSVSRDKLMKTVERARPWVARLSKVFSPRLSFLVQPPFVNLIALSCLVLGLLIFPLAVLPGGEDVPAAGVVFFALALTARDGLLALIGLVVTGAAIGAIIWFWTDITQAFANLMSQMGLFGNH